MVLCIGHEQTHGSLDLEIRGFSSSSVAASNSETVLFTHPALK